MAVNPANGKVYVANWDPNNVSVISGATDRVIATVGTGVSPAGVAVDPTTGNAWVTNSDGKSVSVIDGSTNEVIDTIGVGAGPAAVAIHPITGRVYVANATWNAVSVIDLPNYTVDMNSPLSNSAGQLTWTWSDLDPSITSYSWSGACSGSGNVTTVTCSGLTGGQTYSLSVTATNTWGVSAPASSSGMAQDVPGAVTFSTPTVPGRGQVTFAWSDLLTNGAPITSYSWSGACSGSGNVTTVTCSGLTGGQTYSLSVTATNTWGVGPATSTTFQLPVMSPP